MRNFTRITAILLALFLTVTAKAYEVSARVGDFTYGLDAEKKTARLAYVWLESGDVVIPPYVTYNGETYTVTTILPFSIKAELMKGNFTSESRA